MFYFFINKENDHKIKPAKRDDFLVYAVAHSITA